MFFTITLQKLCPNYLQARKIPLGNAHDNSYKSYNQTGVVSLNMFKNTGVKLMGPGVGMKGGLCP